MYLAQFVATYITMNYFRKFTWKWTLLSSTIYILFAEQRSVDWQMQFDFREDVIPEGETRIICDCGVPQVTPLRVIGGEPVFPHSYPWLAAIVFPNGQVLCGGALISASFVITAAHCLLKIRTGPSAVLVLLGTKDLQTVTAPQSGAIVVPVIDIIPYPAFNPETAEHDIAVVHLGATVPFTPAISPICLPLHNTDFINAFVVVAGWGANEFQPQSDVPVETTLTVVNNSVCEKHFAQMTQIGKGMMCALGRHKDACMGDSGGPLMWNHLSRWYLVGLVSFGKPCRKDSISPGVYTRVNMYLDWIMQVTSNTACVAPTQGSVTPIVYPWEPITANTPFSFNNTGVPHVIPPTAPTVP